MTVEEPISHFVLMVINVGSLVFIGIISYLIRRSIGLIDKRLEAGDERFKEISQQLSEMKEKRAMDREYFAKEYVAKDDFIRDIHALDYKIGEVAQDVKKLLTLGSKERRDEDA